MDEQTRLDKQAAAIKRLRKDRDALLSQVNGLEERIEFLETALGALFQQGEVAEGRGGATPSTPDRQADSRAVEAGWEHGVLKPVLPLVEVGTWIKRDRCLVCGETNARSTLTCKACSAKRMEVIKGVRPRPVIRQCLNCGAYRKGNGGLQYLCKPCREASR